MTKDKSTINVKCSIAFDNMPTIVRMFEEYEKSLPYIPWNTEQERFNALSLFASGMTRYALSGTVTQATIVSECVKAYDKINKLI